MNPFSTVDKQTRQRWQYFVPTTLIKEKWLTLRGMNETGKFIGEDDSKKNPPAERELTK